MCRQRVRCLCGIMCSAAGETTRSAQLQTEMMEKGKETRSQSCTPLQSNTCSFWNDLETPLQAILMNVFEY